MTKTDNKLIKFVSAFTIDIFFEGTRQSAEAAATTKLPAAGIGLLSVIQHSSLLEEMYLQMIKRIKQKWIQLKLLPQIL